MENVTQNKPNQTKIRFSEELMEVIAAVVESMDMDFETYTKNLTEKKIAELHGRIMPQFARIHKSGIDYASAVFKTMRRK